MHHVCVLDAVVRKPDVFPLNIARTIQTDQELLAQFAGLLDALLNVLVDIDHKIVALGKIVLRLCNARLLYGGKRSTAGGIQACALTSGELGHWAHLKTRDTTRREVQNAGIESDLLALYRLGIVRDAK